MRRRSLRPRIESAAALLGLIFAGCSEELGPERIPTTTISGVVVAAGKPLGRGWIEVQPLDGSLGDPGSARLGPDGTFRIDRAPVGKLVVRLLNIPIDLPYAIWLFRNSSPIRLDTQSAPGSPRTIDVMEELYRHRKKMEPAR
ncbi:hypothetical protein [Paludisphaera mucosa]|uniref:Carboxypeptidase regulatory-like domain-containing protein n=1 Tax=Paludisphaera mucosa TaxID=3030827 RepID=A0ABT6F623_9BACT|nr:hypothetical protein [Paludisphaera mucosa]MDG3003038.1 hypothetical protein [Paludisphaera mucosa]